MAEKPPRQPRGVRWLEPTRSLRRRAGAWVTVLRDVGPRARGTAQGNASCTKQGLFHSPGRGGQGGSDVGGGGPDCCRLCPRPPGALGRSQLPEVSFTPAQGRSAPERELGSVCQGAHRGLRSGPRPRGRDSAAFSLGQTRLALGMTRRGGSGGQKRKWSQLDADCRKSQSPREGGCRLQGTLLSRDPSAGTGQTAH